MFEIKRALISYILLLKWYPCRWLMCQSKMLYAGGSWWRHQMKTFFTCCWPFVRGIHRSLVDSFHKGQWRGVLRFSLICAWTNGWATTRGTGDLRSHRTHFDVTVMIGNHIRTDIRLSVYIHFGLALINTFSRSKSVLDNKYFQTWVPIGWLLADQKTYLNFLVNYDVI